MRLGSAIVRRLASTGRRPTSALAALTAAGVLGAAATAAAQSAVIPLWDAAGTPLAPNACAGGQFPIGTANAQGRHWKETLLTWMRNIPQNDLQIPGATSNSSGSTVPVTTGFELAWSAGPLANNYGACVNHPAWSVPPDADDQIEAVVLHAAGDEWGGHGMGRVNVPASQFDMGLIENTASCTVHTPGLLLDPELTSWATLPYDGNPYYANPQLHTAMVLRGALYAALNLLIMDYEWWFNGTAEGAYPCDPTVCQAQANQPGVVISPFTGEVVAAGPNYGFSTYIDHRGNSGVRVFNNSPVHDFSEVGGPLSHAIYSYMLAKPDLPMPVQQAFERAFVSMAERIVLQGTGTVMPNLGHRTVVALWLARDAQSYWANRNYVDMLYRMVCSTFYDGGTVWPQGTFRDVTGFDTGYNNYNLLHMARLLAVDPTPDPQLVEAAQQGFDLWAHLVFPETLANGQIRHFSPSAFNSRTAGMAANGEFDRGVNLQRFLLGAKAGLPWSAAALQHGRTPLQLGGPVAPIVDLNCSWYNDFLGTWIPLAFRSTSVLPASALAAVPPQFPDPELGGLVSRAYSTPNFAFLYRGLGFLNAWETAASAPGGDLLPYELSTNGYYKNFADSFFYAKPLGQGAGEAVSLVHAGQVGYGVWGGLPDGYGGAQLAALWTPGGGPFVLTRRKGRNLDAANNDDWSQWRELPVHAVTLKAANGALTSSTRILIPGVQSRVVRANNPPANLTNALMGNANNCALQGGLGNNPNGSHSAQHIMACGQLPLGIANGNALSAPVGYRRDFVATEGRVTVRTRLQPAAYTPLVEAYETIPLYYGQALDIGPGYHVPGDYSIQFESIVNGQSVFSPLLDPAVTNLAQGYGPVQQVKRVHVTRFGQTMVIEFDTLQRVALSKPYRIGYYDSYNLLVDLLNGQPALANTTLRYTFLMP